MSTYPVRIISAKYVTHNVRQFQLEKPKGYTFIPGQATEISIPNPKWQDERRPFTFTGLNEWDYLQFTIKIYPDHHGVTDQLSHLEAGDVVVLHDVWGAIQYKGEGIFIAGGAGVTPFIAIFRQLHKEGTIGKNQLFFSNKMQKDIILRREWDEWLGPQVHYILSEERIPGLDAGKIDKAFLKTYIADFNQHFYICGPDQMVSDIKQALESLGAKGDLVTVEI